MHIIHEYTYVCHWYPVGSRSRRRRSGGGGATAATFADFGGAPRRLRNNLHVRSRDLSLSV